MIVPAGALPGLLFAREHGMTVGHAPVVNCVAVTFKLAEAAVRISALTGLGGSASSLSVGRGAGRAPRRAGRSRRLRVRGNRDGCRARRARRRDLVEERQQCLVEGVGLLEVRTVGAVLQRHQPRVG